MIPYPRALLLDNTNNYSLIKTEEFFGYGRLNQSDILDDNFSMTKRFPWEINDEKNKGRSLNDAENNAFSRSKERKPASKSKQNNTSHDTFASTDREQLSRKAESKSKGVKKCIFQFMKAGKERRSKKGNKSSKMSKFIVPLTLGVLAAKSMLIPIALKALALLSAKGLLMGLFATMMASIIGLKGLFHTHNSQNRKDDSKAQGDFIQGPSSSHDHYYDDEYYRREDNVPQFPYMFLASPAANKEMNHRRRTSFVTVS